MEFAVVEFIKTKQVAVIPVQWISKDLTKGWWPPYMSSTKITTSVARKQPVDSKNWRQHEIRIFKQFCKL